mgnify:FL=1
MAKNLVIVESPAKAKTIEGYLGKDFIVKSSFGHIRDLPEKQIGVDVANDFLPSYEVSADKKKVVSDLKKLAKDADVWLATDDDREGEAISWHLKEALGLPDETKRIVFREITKNAITKAIQSPRTIDIDLVNAQQARRILDRLVGFELSPVLWDKVRLGAGERKNLSAGRVQSVAVRLIVEREREVEAFDAKSSYKIVALFLVNGAKILQAELPKNMELEGEAKAFLERCVGAIYQIKNLEVKPGKKSPAAPFTTSTLQQEASRKLGFSVSQTMTVAQKLYEAGHITYMRTDSTNLSDEAIEKAKVQIQSAYGEEYIKVRKYKTKNESAQEAHEAIRPTDFSQMSAGYDRNEKRLYELIWKRSIASQMADAVIERTVATVGISTTPELLVATGEVIKFEGFLKVYLESTDDEDEESKGMLPPLSIGQELGLQEMKATQRFAKPAARYTEASLVKKLEELGIGRPSTFAPTISTIIKRNYVLKEDRPGKEREFVEYKLKQDVIEQSIGKETYGTEKAKLFPTNVGIIVNDYLVENFDDVINFQFTAKVEQGFDEIAEGRVPWQSMIKDFYKDFHEKVQIAADTKQEKRLNAKELGIDPESGKKILAKIGKYGPYIQIGESTDEDKPTFISVKKGTLIETITYENALELIKAPKLPLELGIYEDQAIQVNEGRYGPYVLHNGKYYNLAKDADPFAVTLESAIALIEEKRSDPSSALPRSVGILDGEELVVAKGRFGPYIKHGKKNYPLGKIEDPLTVSLERVIEIVQDKKSAEANNVLKEFPENEKVRVLNGRYGPYIQMGKRNIKIPKGTEPTSLTLEECLKLAEGEA